MENVAYIALSHQNALKQQMNVVANNIANMSTPGFKSEQVMFIEHLTEGAPDDRLSMVSDFGSWHDISQGPGRQTGNKLDFALVGDGFFVIDAPGGERYSRAGNFTLNANRELVTPTGFKVMGQGGSPIAIPEGENNIMVSETGAISTESGTVGQLNIVRFENPQSVRADGNSLYTTDATPLPATETKVVQGMIEGSNVESITEMNKMIEILRNYQAVQRMIQNDHERQRSTIQKLSKIN